MTEQQTAAMTVARDAARLIIDGALDDDSRQDWAAHRIDQNRVLLVADDARQALVGRGENHAACTIEVFKEFLLAMHRSAWSGVLAVDTGFGVKRLFLSRGELAFAASNIIDDRLGEVIYREALIKLDELTSSAAQVTKAHKFGQVLIGSGIFTNVQLWDALKLQVKEILRSVFMAERVFFSAEAGGGLAPTEVVYTEPLSELVSEAFAYGCAYRGFLGRLSEASEVELQIDRQALAAEHQPGTFIGDLITLIQEQKRVQDLLNASKLIDSYTIGALFHLVNLGICRIGPESDEGRRDNGPALLKAKIDAYEFVLHAVKRAFADAQLDFPADDIRSFASGLNPDGFPSLYLEPFATLGRDCVASIFRQCATNPDRIHYFVVRFESLIQFLLQVAGDRLDFKVARGIRQDYRAVTA